MTTQSVDLKIHNLKQALASTRARGEQLRAERIKERIRACEASRRNPEDSAQPTVPKHGWQWD